MADLAITFHWSPESMDAMDLKELMYWWDEALKRSQTDDLEDT